MASLTVRQLDEALKKQLRLRAARNGRSVEDEVRTILRGAAAEGDAPAASGPSKSGTQFSRRATPAPAAGTKRVLLIIGGGIAAYKSLDLIRRLKERGLAVRCILTKAAAPRRRPPPAPSACCSSSAAAAPPTSRSILSGA